MKNNNSLSELFEKIRSALKNALQKLKQHFNVYKEKIAVYFKNKAANNPAEKKNKSAVINQLEDTLKHPVEAYQKIPVEQKKRWQFRFNVSFGIIKSLLNHLLFILILLGFFSLGLASGYFAQLVADEPVPTKQQLNKKINNIERTSTLYYAKDQKIGVLRSDIVRTTAKSDEISPVLKNAIMATEDEYFKKHNGIVPKALLRAVFSDVTGIGSQTGGSTLTQQLVKMQILTNKTTFKRKAHEILLALRVDKYFTKDEILTAYLNVATFGRNNKGQNIAGVQEAARGIFGRDANNLTLPQAAFIAGLPQSPFIYTPYLQTGDMKEDITSSLERKNTVLFRMYREDLITKKEYQEAKSYDLTQDFLPKEAAATDQNGFLVNLVVDQAREILIKKLAKADSVTSAELKKDDELYNSYYGSADQMLRLNGYRIETTIDKDIYQSMQTTADGMTLGYTYNNTVTDPETGNPLQVTEPVQTGSILIQNETGKVLGFVGGRDFNLSQVNHAFSSRRSPGSTIKPLLVYAPAVENNLIGTGTQLSNFPIDVDGYKPTNYGGVSGNSFERADHALAVSDNIPAVNLYVEALHTFKPYAYMEKMGINTITQREYQLAGASLGSFDSGLTVAEQANAFGTFANDGEYVPAYVISKIVDPKGKTIYQHKSSKTRVFTEATSYIMNQMMHGVITEGTASSLGWQLDFNTQGLAGKTGTSENYRDIWFVGSTKGVTLTSWMGYDNNYNLNHNLTSYSSGINLRYWAKMANQIYALQPNLFMEDYERTQPSSVLISKVNSFTGMREGNVSVNGSTYNLPADASTMTNGYQPGASTYNFGVGGTADDRKKAWEKQLATLKAEKEKKEKADKAASEKAAEEAKNAEKEAAEAKTEADKTETTVTTETTTENP